jgi:hypothetical protein
MRGTVKAVSGYILRFIDKWKNMSANVYIFAWVRVSTNLRQMTHKCYDIASLAITSATFQHAENEPVPTWILIVYPDRRSTKPLSGNCYWLFVRPSVRHADVLCSNISTYVYFRNNLRESLVILAFITTTTFPFFSALQPLIFSEFGSFPSDSVVFLCFCCNSSETVSWRRKTKATPTVTWSRAFQQYQDGGCSFTLSPWTGSRSRPKLTYI